MGESPSATNRSPHNYQCRLCSADVVHQMDVPSDFVVQPYSQVLELPPNLYLFPKECVGIVRMSLLNNCSFINVTIRCLEGKPSLLHHLSTMDRALCLWSYGAFCSTDTNYDIIELILVPSKAPPISRETNRTISFKVLACSILHARWFCRICVLVGI